MASPSTNLFLRLHKWATRQDENFLTESLAVVLEQLLILAPAVGTRLIAHLTGGFIDLPEGDAGAIEVNTQIETGKGRPDLEIRSPHRLAWIEVKAESVLRIGQLEGYRILLNGSGIAETRLILLTRYPEIIKPGAERPDAQIRWFEVSDWLEGELGEAQSTSDIGGFLVLQLLNFLEVRGMTLTQVGKFMPEGLRALSNLMNMLFEAASACGVSVKRVPEWDSIGFYLDGRKYWVGVIYNDSAFLTFKTCSKIDVEAALNLGVGELDEEAKWVPGRQRWMRWVELDSEEIHFYSRSKLSQMQWLEEFLRDCLAKARSIETPDQPPIPDAPEDSF